MRETVSIYRTKRLFSALDDSIDAVVIINSGMSALDENFLYLTDTRGGGFEGALAVATKRSVTVITSVLEEEIARRSGCKVRVFSSAKEREAKLKSIMRGKEIVGINEHGISHATMKWLRRSLRNIKFKDISKQLMRVRMIKTEDEIERIRKACKIASKVATEIPEILRIDMTEREAAAEIDYLLRCHGADGLAFETIAAFGSASSMPHHMPGKRRLKPQSVALFDFGAVHENYRSDITRTYLTKPKNERIARIYEVVLKAQKAAIAKMHPGQVAKEIDAAAREIISDAGYGKYFIHSTGHGLGISAHDPGALAKRSKDVLRENMVFSVEPGIYLPRRGGVRIEDNVIVTARGVKKLTNASRELEII